MRQRYVESELGCFVRVSEHISLSMSKEQMDRCSLRNAGTGKYVVSCEIVRLNRFHFYLYLSLQSFEFAFFANDLF
jgi:hypothetical protein